MTLSNRLHDGTIALKRMMHCLQTDNKEFFKKYSSYLENKIIMPCLDPIKPLCEELDSLEKKFILDLDNARQSLLIATEKHFLSSSVSKEDALKDSYSKYSSLMQRISSFR